MHAETPPKEPVVTPYDVMEYPSQVHVQTHPERLATIGKLFGLTPAPVTKCRVLEVGCGNAGNIIPMAWSLPDSTFTGLDLAATPIEEGRQLAGHLALKNLKLIQANLLNVDQSWGQFDYVIAHGVYAWVPENVRDQLLAICRQCLAPQGIAFISYNVFPGAHLSVMLRQMMLYHAGHIQDPNEMVRQALALAHLVAGAAPKTDDHANIWVRRELERILKNAPAQVFHDELAPAFSPVLFANFMAHARKHDLQFVGEADYQEMSDLPFSAEAQQALHQLAGDRIRREQYRDFLKNRRFRQTLLTHVENPVKPEPVAEVAGGLAASLHAKLRATNDSLATRVLTAFTAEPGGRVETDFPLGKAALHHLIRRHPEPVPMAALLKAAQQMLTDANVANEDSDQAREKLNGFVLQLCERGLVHLHSWQPTVKLVPGERPTASPIARWQIQREPLVTTLRHRSVQVQDAVGKLLITLLDGTRDRKMLCDAIVTNLNQQGLIDATKISLDQARTEVAERLESNLQKLADMALLVD